MPIVSELLCCNLADYSSSRLLPRMPSLHGSQDGRRDDFCMFVVDGLLDIVEEIHLSILYLGLGGRLDLFVC